MDRGRILRVTLIIFSFLLTVTMIFTGEYFQTTENIKVGEVSPKRFVAPREVENKLATERKKNEIRNNTEPLYKQNPDIEEQAISKIEVFFNKLNETEEYLEEQEKLQEENDLEESNKENISNNTEDIKEESQIEQIEIKEGIYQENEIESIKEDALEDFKKQSSISISRDQFEFLIEIGESKRNELKNHCISIVQSIFNMGVREETKTKSILDVKEKFTSLDLDNDMQNIGYDIVSSVIQPNMIVDEVATQKMLEEKLSEVEPVIILKGQKIVDEGEIITDEIYEILEELGFGEKNFKEELVKYIGVILLICLLQTFIYIYIWLFNKSIVNSKKEMLLLASIYFISMIMIKFLSSLHFAWLPIPIAGMLLAILLDIRLGIVLNGYISVIGALISKEGLDFIIFFFIVGTIFSMLVMNTYKRSRILWVGILAGFLNGITFFSLELFLNGAYTLEILYSTMYAFISGLLAVIITVGSLPFWEVAFDVVTPIKLLELTNPEQPLLKRLLIEAPGTYYHSLVVANLAETAAADIEANSLLARVGGYYHDIGKIVYPQYFKENQVLDNPHDYMEPLVSSKIIQQHVTNGLKIAEEYKLPRAIKDMILQHHGTTCIQYFYYKALDMKKEEDISKEDFSYEGPKPQSKEAALIMLGDTVEAAVRSMDPNDKTKEKIEALIRKLIKSKLDDGQLDESNLTIKDLEIIVQAFLKVFNGMYHERIKYPEKMEEDKNEYFNKKQHIISINRKDKEFNKSDSGTSS
ncbi:HD family phosphohydrolase [Defluviitalea phaphyphila]|uniref:HD family phosphohydrolase n=1 Tax=Defluviitalea phaphyphila TaxID=1473580 RepID=UPI00073023A5|nr:HDIG domain-containing metalloprotein [Defluviitalea phaphyphila]